MSEFNASYTDKSVWCCYITEKCYFHTLDNMSRNQVLNQNHIQSWIYIGKTDAKAETPILWLPDAKNWLIGKDPDAGKDWTQKEKGTTEDEMVGWHHHLNGHGFGCTPGVGDGHGGLVCCGSWGRKESDTTERLNWTELKRWLARNWVLSWACLQAGTLLPQLTQLEGSPE